MKRLAVGVWSIPVKRGEELDGQLSNSPVGRWVPMAELRHAVQSQEKTDQYRPQLLMAAAIASGLCDIETIRQANRAFIELNDHISQDRGWNMCHGVVNSDGDISSDEALRFLGMRT